MSAGRSRRMPGRLSRAGATRHPNANPVRVAPAGGGVPPCPARSWSVPAMSLHSRPEKQKGGGAPALSVNASSASDGTRNTRRHGDPVDTESPETRSPRRHGGPVDMEHVDTKCECGMRGGAVRVGAVRGDGVRGGVVRACAVGQRWSVLVRPGALWMSRGPRGAAPGTASGAPAGRAQRALDLSLEHFGTRGRFPACQP